MTIIRDEAGATAIEYGLIAGMIAVVIFGAIASMGPNMQSLYQSVVDALTSANAAK